MFCVLFSGKLTSNWFQILLSQKNPRKKIQILNSSERPFRSIVVCRYSLFSSFFSFSIWQPCFYVLPSLRPKVPGVLRTPPSGLFSVRLPLRCLLLMNGHWLRTHALLYISSSFYVGGLKGALEPKSGRRYSTGALSALKPASDSATLKSNGSSRIGISFRYLVLKNLVCDRLC